jgi:hypothetical protein
MVRHATSRAQPDAIIEENAMRKYIHRPLLACIAFFCPAMAVAAPSGSLFDAMILDIKAQKISSATVYYLPYDAPRAVGLNAAMLRVAPDQMCEVRLNEDDRRTLIEALAKSQPASSAAEGHDMHWGADFKNESGVPRYSIFLGQQYPGENFVDANYNGISLHVAPIIERWFDARHSHWACKIVHM